MAHKISSTRTFRTRSTEVTTFLPRMFGTHGGIATEHYLSADAGIEMLRTGGTAVDAAVAAVLVESVVNPQMFSIGGEIPILIASNARPNVVCINGNMCAPSRATPAAFRELGHSHIPDEGILAAGVPGCLAALVEAQRQFGRMRFSDVCTHAIDMARTGFPVHAGLLNQDKFGVFDNAAKFRDRWPGSAQLYLPAGIPPAEGTLLRNPSLANVFEHLCAQDRSAGADRDAGLSAVTAAFYRGEIAAEIVKFADTYGGLLQRSDLANFTAPIEATTSIEFGGVELHKCGPWTQGPALLQTLQILRHRDLKGLGHNTCEYIHVVTEAMKLAFADREQYYGDPRHVEVPIAELLSPRYGRARSDLIGMYASREIRPGDPKQGNALLNRAEWLGGSSWGAGTVHVAAVDSEGTVVAMSPSGAWIKSSEVIPALGFPLGSRLSNFHLDPPHHPNLLAPGKRPRTTISPSIALRAGQPWMAFGSMGGDQQDQWQLQFFLNIIVFGMSIQAAIEAPKFSTEHFPAFFSPHDYFLGRLRIEPEVGAKTVGELARRGHDIDVAPSWSEGFLCAARRDPMSGAIEVGADPRGNKAEVFPAAARVY